MKQILKAFVLFTFPLMDAMSGLHQAHGAQQLSGGVAELEEIVIHSDTTYHVKRADKPPVIDGQSDEWSDVPAMRLDREDMSRGLTGTNDLSGSLRLLWDQDAIYFFLEVQDDIHHAPDRKSGWENDCMQFIFDAYMNGPGGGYSDHNRDFCLSDTPDGPVVSMYTRTDHEVLTWMSPKSSVQPDGVRVFEMAMPWSHLSPTHPWVLGRMGFSFSINDNDGSGFKGARFWTHGMLWGRDPAKFGVLIFDEAMGSRDAILELAPEWNLFGDRQESRWLKIKEVDPFTHARLLVNAKHAGTIEVNLTVRLAGESEPIATGGAEQSVGAGETAVFAWDLSQLDDGTYELAFDIPGLQVEPRPHTRWSQLDPNKAHDRKARLTERFGIHRPWDNLADEPAVLRRHRGMVALSYDWLEFNNTLTGFALESALSDIAEMIATMNQGEDYLAGKRREFWSAYYSQFDGSGQLFVAYVPPFYDSSRAWPLVVALHGKGMRPRPNVDRSDKDPYLQVEPWGRGDASYSGIGENDVLEVITFMKEWYNVDSSRVYVKGHSMGGGGTWKMTTAHPDLFAAGGPDAGWSYDMSLENLRHVPLCNRHGLIDWVVPASLSRFGVSRLQHLGYSVANHEIAGAGHGLLGDETWRTSWMLEIQRPAKPSTITYTCQTPETGRAYWLCVRQFGEPHLRARVDAETSGHIDSKTLTLAMENVDVLELNVPEMPLDPEYSVTLQVGEKKFEQPAPLPQQLFVRRVDDNWSVTDAWSPEPSTFRPYRPGAAANLYTGEPLLIVYGTAGDDERTKLLKAAAEKLAGHAGSREKMALGGSPIKTDTAVTEQDMANFNLVLLGREQDNVLVKRMADKLPFTINAQNELIAGDREPVSMNGAELRLFYYNPLAPRRLIFLLVIHETPENVDDWLIMSFHQHPMTGGDGMNRGDQPDLVVQVIGGPVRRKMQFDRNWRWRKVPGVDRRLPQAMGAMRELVKSELRVIQRQTGSDFALSYGTMSDDMRFDPRFITLADVAVENTPRQTMLASMTGEELIEVLEKWPSEDDVCVVPAINPEVIDLQREYKIALPPSFCWKLRERQKNLRNVRAGPDLAAADVWAEVFNL